MGNYLKNKSICLMAGALLFSLSLSAQNVVVKGTVYDENGGVLPGAAVLVSGEGTGTTADVNGYYSLSVSPDATITFSYLGYDSIDEKVGNRSKIDVVLYPMTESMEETVVIAYGTQKKFTMTGAVNNIQSKEILKSPAPSLGNAIAGKIPGVQTIQYSGRPGADDPEIFVRGVNSLNASNSHPLVLVDGVERSFSQIDPNEVADISVLKDASATAVYGVRGANGVILVTTRRGEEGKVSIKLNSSYGMQSITKFLDFADSYEYATMYNYAHLTDGGDPNVLPFSPEVVEHFKNQDMPLLYPSINWMDYLLKDMTPQHQHNINVSGGTKKARYFASMGVLDQEGLFKTFSSDPNSTHRYTRYNYRANIDLTLGKYSTLSTNIGGRVSITNDIGGGEDNLFRYLMDAAPFASAGIVDGKHIGYNELYVGRQIMRDPLSLYYGQGYNRDTKNVLNIDIQYRLDMSFITEGLGFKVKGAYNSDFTHRKTFKGDLPTYKPRLLEDGKTIVYEKSGDYQPVVYDSESSWFGRDWYAEASFDYQRSFNNHNITGLLLYNQSKKYYPGSYSDIPTGYVGLVGRITYNYKTKYLIDMNAGYNGSENFAPGKRYGFFPSVSLGWIITEEPFMKGIEWMSYLKLRASYGIVGSDVGQRFLYLPDVYEIGGGYSFGDKNYRSGAYEKSIGNPNVSWEKAVKRNIGFDLKLFDSKVGLNVDIFDEMRRDILIDNSTLLYAPTAQKSSIINYGKVQSYGYEVQLSFKDRINDFHYSISTYLSYSKNKIIEMAEVPPAHPWMSQTGQSIGQPFGYEFFELYTPGETEKRYEDTYGKPMPEQIVANSVLKPGDAIYVDLDEDGKIDAHDVHPVGKPNYPEFTFGINGYLEYKGFDLSMTWSGAENCSRLLGDCYRPQFGEQHIAPLLKWVYDNSWTEDNPDAILPRISFTNEKQNAFAKSRLWIIDSSYLRLKNLEIGYTFNKLNNRVVRNIRLYMNGNNLLTFTPFKGNDPENTGGSNNNWIRYPQTKVFNVGVSITF